MQNRIDLKNINTNRFYSSLTVQQSHQIGICVGRWTFLLALQRKQTQQTHAYIRHNAVAIFEQTITTQIRSARFTPYTFQRPPAIRAHMRERPRLITLWYHMIQIKSTQKHIAKNIDTKLRQNIGGKGRSLMASSLM